MKVAESGILLNFLLWADEAATPLRAPIQGSLPRYSVAEAATVYR